MMYIKIAYFKNKNQLPTKVEKKKELNSFPYSQEKYEQKWNIKIIGIYNKNDKNFLVLIEKLSEITWYFLCCFFPPGYTFTTCNPLINL